MKPIYVQITKHFSCRYLQSTFSCQLYFLKRFLIYFSIPSSDFIWPAEVFFFIFNFLIPNEISEYRIFRKSFRNWRNPVGDDTSKKSKFYQRVSRPNFYHGVFVSPLTLLFRKPSKNLKNGWLEYKMKMRNYGNDVPEIGASVEKSRIVSKT